MAMIKMSVEEFAKYKAKGKNNKGLNNSKVKARIIQRFYESNEGYLDAMQSLRTQSLALGITKFIGR